MAANRSLPSEAIRLPATTTATSSTRSVDDDVPESSEVSALALHGTPAQRAQGERLRAVEVELVAPRGERAARGSRSRRRSRTQSAAAGTGAPRRRRERRGRPCAVVSRSSSRSTGRPSWIPCNRTGSASSSAPVSSLIPPPSCPDHPAANPAFRSPPHPGAGRSDKARSAGRPGPRGCGRSPRSCCTPRRPTGTTSRPRGSSCS